MRIRVPATRASVPPGLRPGFRRALRSEGRPSGIILPDSAKQKPQRGVVIAVGPGKLLDDGKRAALAVAKGDEVLYGKYSGNDIKIGTKEYKILRESDVLAKIVK